MGTSKGYIPPTTVQWKKSKHAITSYIKSRNQDTLEDAVKKFADAMSNDISASIPFINSINKILSFSIYAKENGIENALKHYGVDYLLGKSSLDIFQELIHEFTNYGNTTEENLAQISVSSALEELGILSFEQFDELDANIFIKEIIIEYIKHSFEFKYYEKILKSNSPQETQKILSELCEYISNELHTKLNISEIQNLGFDNIDSSGVVQKCLSDAYKILTDFYGENEK